MVPAKKFGVKVTQYMVGFGPTLWSRKRGDTEYGLKAVPLGGYIRMIGMVPPRADGSPLALAAPAGHRGRGLPQRQPVRGRRRGRRAAPVLPADARQEDDRDARRPDDEPDHLPGADRPAVHGRRQAAADSDPDRRHRSASAWWPRTRPTASSDTCPADAPGGPGGRRAQAGRRMLADQRHEAHVVAAGRRRSSRRRPARRSTLTIERDGVEQSVSHHAGREHQVRQRHQHQDDPGRLHRRRPGRRHNYFAHESITAGAGRDRQPAQPGGHALGSYPSKIGSLWQTVFEGKPRDPNGAVGVVGLGEIGGQVANSKIGRPDREDLLAARPAGQRQPAAVLVQPAAAAAARRWPRRRRARSRRPSGDGRGCAIAARVPVGPDGQPIARPIADLCRHRPDAAGHVRGGVRPDRA